MPGLWKAWKAKGRLPPLSTSPLGISPKAGEIPTFPQRRRRGGWKSGKPKAGFPLSHRLVFSLSDKQMEAAGLLPPPAQDPAAPPLLATDLRRVHLPRPLT